MRTADGFTLIELILVIAILGILAVSAMPKFVNVSTEAARVSRDGVVGAIRAGIALYRANDMMTGGSGTGSYPTTLDSASSASCSVTNLCFEFVLLSGIEDNNWIKVSNTSYIHNDGTSTIVYTYSPINGTFE